MVQNVTDKPSSSTAKIPSSEELESLSELFSAGKRHLICNEPEKALDLFVELCENLSNIYGQKADECAEAYLYYGKTLLELARLENGVLGHAVKEAPVLGPEEDTENTEDETEKDGEDEPLTGEKRSEIRENVEHAMRDGNLYNDATTEDETEPEDKIPENKESEKAEKETETVDENISEQQTAELTNTIEKQPDDTIDTKVVDAVEDENVGEGDDCGEQDVSNMELSWEMLELTSDICNKMIMEGPKDNLKKARGILAEAKYALAQISMEQEQYERAIEDFQSCLNINTEILEDKLDRRIAEVHYNIGLAFSFDKKFQEAIDSFKKAVATLESRKKMLQEKVSKAEETRGKEKASPELNEWNKEIKELEDLIVLDMNAKIEDAEEMKKQSDIAIQTMKEATKEMFGAVSGFESGFGFDAPTESNEEVHDITSKVRSTSVKRKSDDDESSGESKKAKTTEKESNGAVTNGKANGDVPQEQKPTSVGA